MEQINHSAWQRELHIIWVIGCIFGTIKMKMWRKLAEKNPTSFFFLFEAPEPMDLDGPKGNGYIKTELISVSEV